MSRKGRKRKTGPRGKTGRLLHVNPYDTGTEELQRQRRTLAGQKGDPRMTTTPIDILRTRGLISEPEWEAAQRVLDLRRGYPWPHAKAVADGMPHGHGSTSEGAAEARASSDYLKAMDVVKHKAGPSCVSAVFYSVVSQTWPAEMLMREDWVAFSKRARLRNGLMALAYHFGIVRQVVRRAAA